ncbi:MAG: AMIN domain-containing protein [Gloeotrichia echinulata IR180]
MNNKLKTNKFFQLSQQLFGIIVLSLYAVTILEAGSSQAKPVTKKPQNHHHPILPPPTTTSFAQQVARLDDWRFYPEVLQLEFTLSTGITPRYFYLSQPPRIVVDLPDTKLGYVSTQENYSGAIQKIRVSQLKAGVTRIVLDLAPGNFFTPNQVQLQPVSRQNPTRWVLSLFISGYSPSTQPEIYRQSPNNLPPNPSNYYPQSPNNLPPISNYPQSPNNLAPNPYNYPQAPNNLAPNPYNYPQAPNNLPPTTNNPQQPFFSLPPSSTNLAPTNPNLQQPFVTVPPLAPKNPIQIPNLILPPASFPNQPGNLNSLPPSVNPNFPVPTVPNYPANNPNTGVVEFGQPFPN